MIDIGIVPYHIISADARVL